MFVADNIIFLFGTILTLVSVYLLDIHEFIVDGRSIVLFFILTFFGATFIAYSYLIGFFFKNPDTAFKYSGIVTIILALPPIVIKVLVEQSITNKGVQSFIINYIAIWFSPFGIV